MLIGFSTGTFHKFLDLYDSYEIIHDFLSENKSPITIELSALREKDFFLLLDFLRRFKEHDAYHSIHLPKVKFYDPQLILNELATYYWYAIGRKEKINLIFHPNDYSPEVIERTMKHRSIQNNFYFCLENMDSGKSNSRTVEEFEETYLEYPEGTGVCIDIGHAFQVLKKEEKVLEFFDENKPWYKYIKQVHLSWVNKFGDHCFMGESFINENKNVLSKINVPIILELESSTSYMSTNLTHQFNLIKSIYTSI